MGDNFYQKYLRSPYQSELEYFKNNPSVAGMAAEDDRVILNPYSSLGEKERESVMRNEVARILMRQNSAMRPSFSVTDEQKQRFSKYGSEQDIKETIAARLFSGDSSAGSPTPEQSSFVGGLLKFVEEKQRPKQTGLLGAAMQYLRDAAPGGLLNPELGPDKNTGRNVVRGGARGLLEMAAAPLDTTAALYNRPPAPVAAMKALGVRAGLLDPRVAIPSEAASGALGLMPAGDNTTAYNAARIGVPALLGAAYATAAPTRNPGLLSNQEGAIKVYHGSPHKFDRASSEHIGKGEGAQAYGHGLYWAESPSVAQNYSADRSSVGRFMAGAPTSDTSVSDMAQSAVDVYGDKAKSHLENVLKQTKLLKAPGQLSENKKVEQAIKLIESGAIERKGNLYEASLRWPDPAREATDPLGPQHFLDWDKPLSQQSHAMNMIGKNESARTLEVLNSRKATLQKLGNDHPSAATLKKQISLLEEEIAFPSASGLGKLTGGEYHNYLRRRDVDPKAQADMFRSAGIPGITYLDAGSRAAGDGTRNYVTFDDALIELLKRNNQPIR